MKRVLSPRELNRATLARQQLLRRARQPVVKAIERVAGLQAQWAPTAYVGLWTRLEGFRRTTLEHALRRQAVMRGVLMRGTVHLVSASDYALFGAALDVAPPGWVTPEAQKLATRIKEPLRAFASEPRTKSEIIEWLAREHGLAADESLGYWYALRIQARIAHASASSFWRAPQRPLFVAVDHDDVDPEHARTELVQRYLSAFGPATRAELANWSGIRVRDFTAALERLQSLRRFSDEQGRELLDLPRMPLPAADTPAPVRFLPKWDNVLLDRWRVLPEEYRSVVVRKNADVQQTFLVDGFVAGTWRFERGRVELEPFAPLPRAAGRELADEAERLAEFLR